MNRISLSVILVAILIAHACFATTLFENLQVAIQNKDVAGYLALVAPEARESEKEFMNRFLQFGARKVILRPAIDDPEHLFVHVLLEKEEEARFEAWKMEKGNDNGRQVIRQKNVVSSITGLFRLRMSQLAVPLENLYVRHHDAHFHFLKGQLFTIHAGSQVAGGIFIGTGKIRFAPADPSEQQQLSLFCKRAALETSFEHLYIRGSQNTMLLFFARVISEKTRRIQGLQDGKTSARAQEIARRSDRNAFGVRLPLSQELWFPQLQGDDLYMEIKTPYGVLIYQYAPNEVEDVLLIQKDTDRIISLYPSTGMRSRASTEEPFSVLSYWMNVDYDPGKSYFRSAVDLKLRALETTASLIFKLNPSLRVSEIRSGEESLIYFQEKNTNNLHVVLSAPLLPNQELTLHFRLEGTVEPDQSSSETQTFSHRLEGDYFLPPSFLFSNQSLWYPQLHSRPYSPLEIQITVPEEYVAIANGILLKREKRKDRAFFHYKSDLPLKYFSLLIGRMSASFDYQSIVPIKVFYYSIDKREAQRYASSTDRILRFYAGYFGPFPYASLTLALRPADKPGGHAPGSIVIANRVFTYFQLKFEQDPLYIPEFPELLLAHEIAHQWWGQAVGWKNYRDQWISEGFAQFAAAEYIRFAYGESAWLKLSKIFQRWVEEKTHAGPIILGSRLGHLVEDRQAYTALLYNKGAYVLNMLKLWIGQKKFQSSLAQFYQQFRFKRAEIQDFQNIVEKNSGEDLGPFFDQWLNGWEIPEIRWKQQRSSSCLKLTLEQKGKRLYLLKIPVELRSKTGEVKKEILFLDQFSKDFEMDCDFEVSRVLIDPSHENLFRLL